MGGKTYQLIGLAPEKHRETLRNAALSLRPLTEVERGAVTGKRLRIVAARSGERLGEPRRPQRQCLVSGLHRPGERFECRGGSGRRPAGEDRPGGAMD